MRKIKNFQYGGQQFYTADYLSKNTISDTIGWQNNQLSQGFSKNPGLFGSGVKPMKSLGVDSIKLDSGLKGVDSKKLAGTTLNSVKKGFNLKANMGMIGGVADSLGGMLGEANNDETTASINAGYDALSNAAMGIPGVGTAIGGAMKVGSFLNKGLSAITGGATTINDPGTTGDKILSSNFFALSPIGLANSLFKKKVKGSNTDLASEVGSGYSAQNIAGKEFGGITSLFGGKKKRKKLKKNVARANKSNILAYEAGQTAETEELASINAIQDVTSKNNQNLSGGINTRLLAAQKGTSFKNIIKNVKNKKESKKEVNSQDSFEIFLTTAPKNLTDIDNLKESWKLNDKPKNFDESTFIFKKGGAINVIPDGAFHSRKHNIELEGITKKGIPVVSYEEGGKSEQHAEVEVNEVIFHLELTKKLEVLFEKFNKTDDKKEKDSLMIEAGKLLTEELLENTDDKTNLIESIK